MAHLVYRGLPPGFNVAPTLAHASTSVNPSILTNEEVNKNFFGLNEDIQTRVTRATDETITGHKIFNGTALFNNTLTSTGWILMSNLVSNMVIWNMAGVAAPTLTSRSAGTKLVIYPNISGSSVDYAIGIESSTMWLSIPGPSEQFKWYAGTTNIATLTGTGNLTVATSISAPTLKWGSNGKITSDANWGALYYPQTDGAIAAFVWTNAAGTEAARLSGPGDFTAKGTIQSLSDPKLKTNIEKIKSPLTSIKKLDGVTFDWRSDIEFISNKAGKSDVGVLADQVQKVFPQMVNEIKANENDSYLVVAYEKLIPVLIEAIKELDAKVTKLSKGK